ncbi:MAG: glycosyltransferase, partial [Syntrophales bacterium]|nr:glycosyltransferase [Syntrophales bacterium]
YSLAKLWFLTKNRREELTCLVKLRSAGNRQESVLNRLAVILLEDEKLSDAIIVLGDLLSHSPDNMQALINIGIAYKKLTNYQKAMEAFMRIIELAPEDSKPWYHLYEISLALGKPDDARIFMAKAQSLEKTLSPQTESCLNEASVISSLVPSREKIAFLVKEKLDKFLDDIITGFSSDYETKKFTVANPEQVAPQIEKGMQWADICWFEWCDDLIVHASQLTKPNDKKIICRLHSYEAFTDYPRRVDWTFVDRVVFVANHIRDYVLETVPAMKKEHTDVVPNGIDLQKYRFRKGHPGYNLAFVGIINYKKDPLLLLQSFKAIYDLDHRYKLHIAGTFDDDRYILYFRQMIKEMKLEDNLVYDGWQDDLDKWLEDKDFIICTSVLESQNMGIMQAMSKGIKPLIHNFVGARNIYPDKYIWNTIDDCKRLICETEYRSEEYRQFVAERYALSSELEALRQILKEGQ